MEEEKKLNGLNMMTSKNTPKVSIIWLNYNSNHIFEIVAESIKSLITLKYPNYEVIIVDNGSYDGSFKKIKKLILSIKTSHKNLPPIKVIRLRRNLGFTGGNNAGFKIISKDSKYVAVLNNDCVVVPGSLRTLINIMERCKSIGAVQGVIVKFKNKDIVDSAGGYIDELINTHFVFQNQEVYNVVRLPPRPITFVEGTYAIYRVEAIEKILGKKRLFITEGFMYFLEDVYNGLALWNLNYKCLVVPVVSGFHYRKAIISKYKENIKLIYFLFRNKLTLALLTNSRYKYLVVLELLIKALKFLILGKITKSKYIVRALMDSVWLYKVIKKKYNGRKLNLCKAPIVRTSFREFFRNMLS